MKIRFEIFISILSFFIVNSISCMSSSKPLAKSPEELKYETETKTLREIMPKQKFNRTQWNSVSAKDNRDLWYSEIQTSASTEYTTLWDDYSENQYHADLIDFRDYFEKPDSILFAIQVGPAGMMWTYYTYIGKRISDSLIEIAQSTFTHNRFVYKSKGRTSSLSRFYKYLDSLETIACKFYSRAPKPDTLRFKMNVTDKRNNKENTGNIEKIQEFKVPQLVLENKLDVSDSCKNATVQAIVVRKNPNFTGYYADFDLVPAKCKNRDSIGTILRTILNTAIDSSVKWTRTY